MRKSTFLIFSISIIAVSACQKHVPVPGEARDRIEALQCSKDTDCKGERICEGDRCVSPSTQGVSEQILGLDRARRLEDTPELTSPLGQPSFMDYPSGPIYTGPTSALAGPNSEFKSAHSEALSHQDIEFASEYVISTVGCGTGCVFQDVLSKRTGTVLKTAFGGEGGERIIKVRPDSTLLLTEGPNESNPDDKEVYVYFYVLKDGALERITKMKADLLECEGSDICNVESADE